MVKPFPRLSPDDVTALKGSTYNAIVSAVETYLREREVETGSGSGHVFRRNAAVVRGANKSGVHLPAMSVVGVSGSAFSATSAGFLKADVYDIVGPSATTFVPGIVLQMIGIGQIGEVVVAGLAKVKVDVTVGTHRYAKLVDSDVSKLASSYFEDDFEIVWRQTDPGTGLMECVVRFHAKPQTMAYAGAVTGVAIPAGGTGTVAIHDKGNPTGETITAHLDRMHGGQQVSVGKQVEVKYYRNEDRWRITLAECES